LPAAQKNCDVAESIAQSDPVKAVTEVIPAGRQKADDGLSLIGSVKIAREEVFPKLDQSSDQLKELKYQTRWIGKRVDQLGDRADQLMEQATDHSVSEQAVEFQSDVKELGERAVRTLELAQQVEEETLPAIEKLKQSIEDGRSRISTALQIPASTTLREKLYDPDLELAQAQKQLQSAKAAINYGGVESAMESIEESAIELDQGHLLVESSLTVVKQFAGQHAEQNKNHQQLCLELADRETMIQSTQARYSDTALQIRDESFIEKYNQRFDDQAPTAESLFNNCQSALDDLAPGLAEAQQSFGKGEVLSAANLLDLIQNEQQTVDQILGQISQHCEEVDEVSAGNKGRLEQRVDRMASLTDDLADNRTQEETMVGGSALETNIRRFFDEFNSADQKRDPFADASAIEQFDENLDALVGELQADRQAYDAASNAVTAGGFELVASQKLVARSLNDSIPDSVETEKCQDDVTTLEVQLGRLKKSLEVPHGNWVTVNSEATQLNQKIAEVSRRLRQELEQARHAVDLVATASTDVFSASNWRGKYGIVVVGNPGVDELDRARALLANGNYHRSIEFSRSASLLSGNAIDAAKRQVARKRRSLAREAEEARRRRRRRQRRNASSSFSSSSRSSSSSSSSFGSRSSSSSSFSSRSSSSRSSGGGSGFGTSGW